MTCPLLQRTRVVGMRRALRVDLMMCPLYSYSEEKNYEFSIRLFIRDGASV